MAGNAECLAGDDLPDLESQILISRSGQELGGALGLGLVDK